MEGSKSGLIKISISTRKFHVIVICKNRRPSLAYPNQRLFAKINLEI